MLADYTFIKEKHHLSYIYYTQTYVSITFVYDFVLLCCISVSVCRCFFNFLHTNQKLYISNIFKKKSSHHHLYIFYKKENILLIFLFPLFYYYDIVIKFIFIHRYISYRYIYYIYRIQTFSNHLFTDFTPDV